MPDVDGGRDVVAAVGVLDLVALRTTGSPLTSGTRPDSVPSFSIADARTCASGRAWRTTCASGPRRSCCRRPRRSRSAVAASARSARRATTTGVSAVQRLRARCRRRRLTCACRRPTSPGEPKKPLTADRGRSVVEDRRRSRLQIGTSVDRPNGDAVAGRPARSRGRAEVDRCCRPSTTVTRDRRRPELRR